VLTQPTNPNQFCGVGNGSGQIHANVTNVTVNCSSVGALYPLNGGNWNDYVINDGVDSFHGSDQACTIPVARSAFGACIHGGELRMWDSMQNIACSGQTSGTGSAVFISTGLKPGRRLSDLIDFATPAWRLNRIEISGGATFQSPWDRWWGNPVVVRNNGGLLALGAIHVVTADTQATYQTADRTALVVQPGIVLSTPAGAAAVTGANLAFWLEGEIDASGGSNGVYIQGFAVTVLRGVRVSNAPGYGIYITSDSSTLMDVIASNNLTGIWIGGGGGFYRLTDVVSNHNSNQGVRIRNSFGNRISGLTASNNGYQGVELENATDTLLWNVTAANNGADAIWFWTGQHNLGVDLMAVNNGGVGIRVAANYNTIADVAGTHNVQGVSSEGVANVFTGLLKVGNNSNADCAGSPGSGLLSSCTNDGTSDATITTGVSLATSVIGKFGADDPQNASDTNGTAVFENISDWTHFANSLRGWGPDGNVFPDTSNRGLCVSGATCRIWDWSLASADSVVREVLALPTGNDVLIHRWSPTSEPACQTIPGAVWDAIASSCTSTFLRHALEIDGDGSGNDNGLCESGEACLYTPNIGAYQGHGDLQSAGTFVNGTLSDITLWRYSDNGR
jgi:parallel beta-helix repeat protein